MVVMSLKGESGVDLTLALEDKIQNLQNKPNLRGRREVDSDGGVWFREPKLATSSDRIGQAKSAIPIL
jgi:hypothetical protein